MQNNFISSKNFEDTCIIYSASKPVEAFMVSHTNNVINRHFDTILQRFQQAIETSTNLRMKVVLYCIIIFRNRH